MLETKKRSNPESKTCKAWLQWLKLQYPVAHGLVVKIDNEGSSNRAEAVRSGLHVGASDYLIALPTPEFAGLWLEAKPEGWKLTPSKLRHHERQMIFGRKMIHVGYQFKFCVGVDELIKASIEYLKSSRIA